MYNSRVDFLASTGAYEPTRPGKRPYSNFTHFLTSPNSRANERERQELVNFSRFLCQTGIGTAFTNRLTNLCIGSGLSFRASVNAEFLGLGEEEAKAKNKEFTRFWKLFFNGENGNYDRMYNGGYFQSLTFKSMLEGGDNFIFPARVKPRKNHRFPFALQTFESERVSTPYGNQGNNRFIDGIEQNDQGIPYRVHVAKSVSELGQKDKSYFSPDFWQPLQIFGQNTGVRQVFQLKNLGQDRPGAMRGIPFLTPATGMIIDHNELSEAVLKAAKIQSIFAVLWSGGKGGGKMGKAPSGNQTSGTTSTFPRVDLTGGQAIDLPEGYDMKGFQSTQPGKDYTPFQMHNLAMMSGITGIPRSFVLMLFEKSYSASKGETSLLWTTVLRNRFAYVFQFLFPFWEYLLSYGVASGLISAPGFFDDPETRAAWLGDPIHQFTGPRMPQLDLEKEMKGLVLARNAGFQSTRGIIESTSENDPDEVFKELEEEKEKQIFQAIVNEVANNSTESDDEDQEGEEDE